MNVPFERLANPDQAACARRSLVIAADGRPYRAVDVDMVGGFRIRILPDRGFDIQDCWFAGRPLHWVSRQGEGLPANCLQGHAWDRHFSGGLLTTCGLANVGSPSEGHGHHGRYNHQPAESVTIDRIRTSTGFVMRLGATIFETTPDGAVFRVDRLLELRTGIAVLRLRDRTTNLSDFTAPAPLLYHLNFGWPLIGQDTQLSILEHHTERGVFGDATLLPGGSGRPGMHAPHSPPVTVEHVIDGARMIRQATLSSPAEGLRLDIVWGRRSLPRLLQWINCRDEAGVVAIEPSNCATRGRAHERAHATLPLLAAGQTRVSRLAFLARQLPLNDTPNAKGMGA